MAKYKTIEFIKGLDYSDKIIAVGTPLDNEGCLYGDDCFMRGEEYEIENEDNDYYYFKPYDTHTFKLPKNYENDLYTIYLNIVSNS